MSKPMTRPQQCFIFVLARKAGHDNKELHDLVKRETGKGSLRILNQTDFAAVIAAYGVKDTPQEKRKPHCKKVKQKYEELDGRPGWASGAQLRKIEVIWKKGRGIRDRSDQALGHFLHSRCGISALQSLPAEKAAGAIEALKAITERPTPQMPPRPKMNEIAKTLKEINRDNAMGKT